MAKVSIEVPTYIHLYLKRKQLAWAEQGRKVNLKELYGELIRQGIEANDTSKRLQHNAHDDSVSN